MTPNTEVQWRNVAEAFRQQWNFHHVLVAIDGKHIAIQKPPHAGSDFYNCKKFHSIIIMAVVDANYKFIWLNIDTNGTAGNAQIWNNSQLKLRKSTDRLHSLNLNSSLVTLETFHFSSLVMTPLPWKSSS